MGLSETEGSDCEPGVEIDFAQSTSPATPLVGGVLLPETNGTSESEGIAKTFSDPFKLGPEKNKKQSASQISFPFQGSERS